MVVGRQRLAGGHARMAPACPRRRSWRRGLGGLDSMAQAARVEHADLGRFHHRVQRDWHMVDDPRRPRQLDLLDGHRHREHLPLRKKRNALGGAPRSTAVAIDGWFEGISWFSG